MRKRGPCLHCGITFDLHWRQGPKDKPVLCNSCGIRYKNWGNLENYSPRHCPQIHNNNLQVEKDEEDPSSNDQDSESDNDTTTRAEKHSEIENMTPMEKFQKQLFDEWTKLGRPSSSSPNDVLIFDNVNNFIPSNEVGLGAMLLKPDEVHDDRPQNNVDLSQPQKTVKRTRSKRRMTTAKLLGNYKK
ncbi:GATA transcription factor [Trifolium repens]|nr:GATA transcription factor [Trifolium repens]